MRFQIILLILTIFAAVFLLKLNYNPVVEQAHYGAGSLGENVNQVASVASSPSNPLVFAGGAPGKLCNIDISAKAGLAKYLDNQENIFELNANKILPMASVSKLMTAVIAMERMSSNQQIKIDGKTMAIEGDSNNFESGGFVLNEVFRAGDLMKAMLMVSSNKAAAALAENFDKKYPRKSEKEFVSLMNQKANNLGMSDTYYQEETGLSALNLSTAVDLSKLGYYIYYHHPEILSLTTPKERKIFDLESGSRKNLVNIDIFAGDPDFIGGKTGYLDDKTGHNLLAIFKKNNRPVLTIILDAANAFDETKKLLNCFN